MPTTSKNPGPRRAPSRKKSAPGLSGLKPAEALALKVVGADLEKHARDLVAAGKHDVDFLVRVVGRLSVGADVADAAKSKAPDTNHLVAYILQLVGVRKRAQILRELPQKFAENGCELPKVDELCVDQVKGTLERLRRQDTGPRRGAVTGEFEVVPMALDALAMVGARERIERRTA